MSDSSDEIAKIQLLRPLSKEEKDLIIRTFHLSDVKFEKEWKKWHIEKEWAVRDPERTSQNTRTKLIGKTSTRLAR